MQFIKKLKHDGDQEVKDLISKLKANEEEREELKKLNIDLKYELNQAKK